MRACDLFAGAGGFSLGAHLAGIEVVAAVENNKYACASYTANLITTGLTKARIFPVDITHLEPQTVRDETVLAASGCDILLGGPPCQGFSAHRLNDAGVDDPRNSLLLRYFEYVRVLRPLFFLVENVPGLLWPKHAKFLSAFYELADAANYAVLDPAVLNARDYGVPQNRRRVFLLGFDRTRIASAPNWPPAASNGPPGNELGLPEWRTASVAFSSPALAGDLNDVHMNHGEELIETFKRTPENGGSRRDSGRTLPCHKEHKGHHDVYGRIDPRAPAPTMTTACINPSKGRFVHPTEHHGITLRQAARIQSFPDWYTFDGGIMAGGVQVGNAVPVLMAEKLLTPLRDAVREYRKAPADVDQAA
ncbi:DNA cytosine methyltransferase [Ancylobacter sp. SL191]|uniref:DNA cytosine methyltransferase n=1 Tax=Ancylobacter sp. SL191 TaxID=2995166 RepID=UPI00226DDFC8|nr:DNA cytosine methyltransferase [Ancylobacter sp. SL191]